MMSFVITNWWIGVLMLLPIAVWLYRHERSYRTLLTAELENYGFTYLSEESPNAFDTGPFPKFTRPKLIRSRVHFLGIRGDWTTYRLVHFLDDNNEEQTAWVKIHYEMFKIDGIEWNPFLYSFVTNKQKKRDTT
ncbi:MAG TPA: hypothetical protein PLD25_30180 [Chloroflexota bacterium]|nr:hypothetical protein [Chloroflexota bacterium]